MSTYTITDAPSAYEGRRTSTFPNLASSQQGVRRKASSTKSSPFSQQIRETNEQITQLTQTVSTRTKESRTQRKQIERLEAQLERIEGERTKAISRLEACEKNDAALRAEAERAKQLAVGTTGAITGLGIGLAYGVTGPKLLAYGVAGGAVALAGREVSIHVTRGSQ